MFKLLNSATVEEAKLVLQCIVNNALSRLCLAESNSCLFRIAFMLFAIFEFDVLQVVKRRAMKSNASFGSTRLCSSHGWNEVVCERHVRK